MDDVTIQGNPEPRTLDEVIRHHKSQGEKVIEIKLITGEKFYMRMLPRNKYDEYIMQKERENPDAAGPYTIYDYFIIWPEDKQKAWDELYPPGQDSLFSKMMELLGYGEPMVREV